MALDPDERERRRKRREERSARSAAEGPTPHNTGPKKKTTDVARVKAAHLKRKRKAERRLENTERAREGRRR